MTGEKVYAPQEELPRTVIWHCATSKEQYNTVSLPFATIIRFRVCYRLGDDTMEVGNLLFEYHHQKRVTNCGEFEKENENQSNA